MRALLLVVIAATPLALAASFAAPPPGAAGALLPCGEGACLPLLPHERAVRVAAPEGASYAFLVAGQPLAEGRVCGEALLDVPEGASVLVVAPGGGC